MGEQNRYLPKYLLSVGLYFMYTSGIVGRFFSSISNDWNSKFSHRVTSCYTIFTTLSTIIMNYGKFQHYHNLFCGAWFGQGPIRAKNASQNTGPEKKLPSLTLSVNFTISHTKQGLVVLFPLSFNIPKATLHNFAPLDVFLKKMMENVIW